jgi:hypothetical protein
MKTPEQRIQKWIGKNKVGTKFKAGRVAKDLNLLPESAGNFISKQPNVKRGEKTEKGYEWEIIVPGAPA